MPFNDYHFVSRWRILGRIEEVYDLIEDAKGLPRWWPAAFADALEIQPGDASGVEKVVRFETRGWLPYSLLWHASVLAAERPHRFRFRAWGDFDGAGEWRFEADGDWTAVTYDWHVQVKKPVVRYLSPLLKPLFASNHHWAMAKGEESLRLELAKRHAATEAERSGLAAPPPAVRYPALPVVLGAGAVLAFVLWKARRPRQAAPLQ